MSAVVEPLPLLELRGVCAGYGGIEVLHGVELSVPQGAVVALRHLPPTMRVPLSACGRPASTASSSRLTAI